jgi:bifunctional DNA-binding transcriptional regulator/antitoxin component of YhaV-PrlF toxin-antitoxin module
MRATATSKTYERSTAEWMADLYARVKGMPRISSKNQITLPVETLRSAGLAAGDEVSVTAEGADRIVVTRTADPSAALGVFDGLYEPGYLERLRAEDWD